MTYPSLPFPPARLNGEPAMYWGSRILRYVITTRIAVTCTDEQLEQAEHAAVYAVAAPELHPAALEAIHQARLEIARTQARRRAEAAIASPPDSGHAQPNEGPMAPLRPHPETQPPAGTHVDEPERLIRF